MQIISTALLGLGTVNRGLVGILIKKDQELKETYGIQFNIKAVSDSSGIALHDAGFNLRELLQLKEVGSKVSSLPGYIPGVQTDDIAVHADASLLIESSPVNLDDGNPGLKASRDALQRGWNVVFANKAPLTLAFDEIHQLAKKQNCQIAYSATVCGGLPVINTLQRDFRGASLKSFKGILNATTNHILKALESGGTMEDAIKEAQRVGAAEADPMHDVCGHDAANKLFIIMKSFTDYGGSIKDFPVEGIENVTSGQLREARERGNAIKLITLATPKGNSWELSVKPEEIKANSFLGQCEGWEMAVEIESDFYEKVSMKIVEEDPIATSAAVFRDMVNFYI